MISFVLSYTCTISLRGIYEAIFNVTFPTNLDSSQRNDGITKTTTSKKGYFVQLVMKSEQDSRSYLPMSDVCELTLL